jgi:hypothetical protein
VARCERLDDLATVLQEVQTWPEIVVPKASVYYIKRTPFLHFHDLSTGRAADARDGREWGERIALPYPLSRADRGSLLRELRRRYENTLEAFAPAVRPRR